MSTIVHGPVGVSGRGTWDEHRNPSGHIFQGPQVGFGVPVTITTAGVVAYTAAQLLSGLILRNPSGAGRADTLPTAALLAAAIKGVKVGSTFDVTIRNTATAAETITASVATGVTISGTATIAQNNSKTFRIVFTNVTAGSEAYTAYSLGSVVH